MKKAAKIIETVFSWFLLLAMIICIGSLVITKIGGGEPHFLGYRIFVVVTPSMTPTLNVGDVILSKTFSPGDELKINDILTYQGMGETEGVLVTHRLVAISGEVGERELILKGDANNTEDQPFDESRVVAVEICKLRIFGKIYSVMQSEFGMPILIIIILFFIVREGWDFYKECQKDRQRKSSNNEKENEK